MKKLFAALLLVFSFGVAMAQKDTQTIKIKTSAVCDMCKAKIERDLAFEKGVVSSDLDIDSQILTVNFKPGKTNPEKIKKAISKVGYDADEIQADLKSYEKLDACCKKDQGIH
jgi:periplasmic mercuric ion binding protein